MHSYLTKNSNYLVNPKLNYTATIQRKMSLKYTGPTLFNDLPDNVWSLPLTYFISKLKTILKSHCLYNVDEFYTLYI